MKIEFDHAKDLINQQKHGVSLASVVDLDFETAIVREDDRSDYGETRWRAAGLIGQRLHVLAFTMRGDTLRPISLRKANARERTGHDKSRSEEHTSELQSLMRTSYSVLC